MCLTYLVCGENSLDSLAALHCSDFSNRVMEHLCSGWFVFFSLDEFRLFN